MIIDLHSHILQGMDDGSKDTATSMAMLSEMKRQGVEVVAATSHFYRLQNDIAAFTARREAMFRHLLAKITGLAETASITELRAHPKLNDYPKICLGAETAYYTGISEDSDLKKLCYEGTNTLLLEMPFTEWTTHVVEEVETLVQSRGLRVVLAHPERFLYSKYNKSSLAQLMRLPVGIQVNAETLVHFLSRRQGLALLKEANYPLLGSDSHGMNHRAPNLFLGREVIKKKLGSDMLARMDAAAAELLNKNQ